eukprot:11018639-Karenia_brevis.AAC.1
MMSGAPEEKARTGKWRVDPYANRVVYERQMTALLKIVRREQTDSMCQLLVTAEVGKLDSWAARAVELTEKEEKAE